MLTVLVPTAARPGMLRTALRSVADQDAVGKIERIVVSENGGSRDSEKVCAEFGALPIDYLFRSPAVTPLEHGRLLFRAPAPTPYTAVLHDDDWWAPHHLRDALAALEANPDATAYGSGHFVVSGESSMLNCSGNLFPWFGSGYAAHAPWWRLSRLNVLLGELLGTLSHYSTLVARTGALRQAAAVFDRGNTFDNDRMILFALSTAGPLLFNPLPGAFVRQHGVQDCFQFGPAARSGHMRATTRWMVETSGKAWDLVFELFAQRLARCPAAAAPTLQALARQPWCLPEMKRHLAAGSAHPLGGKENLEQLPAPELEDRAHVAADEQPVHERATPRPVANFVAAERRLASFLKCVGMMPQAVGPAHLDVDEPMRRLPGHDFRLPPDGQAMDADPVVEGEARAHDDRLGRQDLELQPRRREHLEVARLGEEGENLADGPRDEQLGA